MKTSEVLREAKALIDTPRKWRRGASLSNGRRCAVNAVYIVDGADESNQDDAYEKLSANLLRKSYTVSEYNDHPSTTHANMMALFDLAIAAAEEAES